MPSVVFPPVTVAFAQPITIRAAFTRQAVNTGYAMSAPTTDSQIIRQRLERPGPASTRRCCRQRHYARKSPRLPVPLKLAACSASPRALLQEKYTGKRALARHPAVLADG